MNKDKLRRKFEKEHPLHQSIQRNVERRAREVKRNSGNPMWRALEQQEREYDRRHLSPHGLDSATRMAV